VLFILGPEATRRLRAMGYRHLIIGVTGNALDVDVRDFEESGADVVLLKPLRLDLLAKILEYCQSQGTISDFMSPYANSIVSVLTDPSVSALHKVPSLKYSLSKN
jgi:CheY-like chemotaxis protein